MTPPSTYDCLRWRNTVVCSFPWSERELNFKCFNSNETMHLHVRVYKYGHTSSTVYIEQLYSIKIKRWRGCTHSIRIMPTHLIVCSRFHCVVRLMRLVFIGWSLEGSFEIVFELKMKLMRYFGLNHRPSSGMKMKLKEPRSYYIESSWFWNDYMK